MASEEPHTLHSPKTKAPSSPLCSFSFHSPWPWLELQGSPADRRDPAPGEKFNKWDTKPLLCYSFRTTRQFLTFYINNNIHLLIKHLQLPGFLLTNSSTTLFWVALH